MPHNTETPEQNAAKMAAGRYRAKHNIKRPTVCPKCKRKFPKGKKGLEWAHQTYVGKNRVKGQWLCRSCHRKKDIGEKRKPGAPYSHHQAQKH